MNNRCFSRIIGAAALAALLGGCSPVIRNHGYVPIAEDLAQLTIGVDTRDSVIAAVGAPSSVGLANESGLYYVASRFRHFGALAPEETNRQIVALSFNPAGVLTNIEEFSLEDGQVVALTSRVTDSPVQDRPFLRQLLGNVGNVDASALLGDS